MTQGLFIIFKTKDKSVFFLFGEFIVFDLSKKYSGVCLIDHL